MISLSKRIKKKKLINDENERRRNGETRLAKKKAVWKFGDGFWETSASVFFIVSNDYVNISTRI